jgi:hypothetical protein
VTRRHFRREPACDSAADLGWTDNAPARQQDHALIRIAHRAPLAFQGERAGQGRQGGVHLIDPREEAIVHSAGSKDLPAELQLRFLPAPRSAGEKYGDSSDGVRMSKERLAAPMC